MWTRIFFMLFLMTAMSGEAVAGDVIIDGTDANEHGCFSDGTDPNNHCPVIGRNFKGWAYMQRALEVLAARVPDGVEHVIVVVGTQGDAREAINSAFSHSQLQGWSLRYLETEQAIEDWLADLPNNRNKTGILLIPTFNAFDGDLTPQQMAIVNEHAAEIAEYVKEAGVLDGGGNLFAMGEIGKDAKDNRAYKWVEKLVPGIRVTDLGEMGVESRIELTAAGRKIGLPEEDIADAVPWHNYFDLSNTQLHLISLATARQSGVSRNVIIGTNLPEVSDLEISKSALSDSIKVGSDIVYRLAITNKGPDPASSVTVEDSLPSALRFRSVVAPSDWICDGPNESGTLKCQTPQLAAGQSDSIEITTTATCPGDGSTMVSNMATVQSSTPDLFGSNNAAVATLRLEGVPEVTLPESTIKFKKTKLNAIKSGSFTIRNTGCAALSLTLDSITRTGKNVDNKRITDPDDSQFFRLKDNQSGEIIPVNAHLETIAPNNEQKFRIEFAPVLPPITDKKTGLSAREVLSSEVSSKLTFRQTGGTTLVIVDLKGKVPSALHLFAPVNIPRSASVELDKSGDKVTVTFYVFDSGRDVQRVLYDFFNKDGSRITVDKPETDLKSFVEKFVVGQSIGVTQDFSGANRYRNLCRVQVTVFNSQGNRATGQADLPACLNSSAQSLQDTSGVLLLPLRKESVALLHRPR
jgi:uncharacterized repeat protein (TIGR01451 family)